MGLFKKGSYKEVEGNLLDMFDNGDFDYIAHGCNCHTSMSGGIAWQIASRYPQAKRADDLCETPRWRRGGTLSASVVKDKGIIFNLYTQYYPGPDFRMEYLIASLKRVANTWATGTIGLPMIGAGIGGGEWKKIKKVIKKELSEFDVVVVIYKQ